MRTNIARVMTCLALATWGLTAAQPATAQTPGAEAPKVSLSLHDALQLALANNLTYQSALTDERSAEAQVVQARSAFQPTLNTGYSYFHTQSQGAFEFIAISPTGPRIQKVEVSAQNVNSVNATLLYALYTGGAAQAAIGQAAAHLAQTQSVLAGLRNSLIEETTSRYFHLIQNTRSAQVADTAYDVANQDLKTATELYTAGTAAKVDVLRTQVTVSDARLNQIRAHNDVSLANAQLANTLNVNLGSIITPTDTLEIQAPTYGLDSLLTSAKGRPELAAAHDAVTIAEKAVQSARSAYLPNVDLQVQEASTLPNFVGVPQPQLSETLAVTWQLFSGGLTRGKVQQALADVDKANINLKNTDNSVDLEVREAYFNYIAAEAAVDAAQTLTTSARENFRVNRIRFKAGVGTSLELSDALLSSTQAEDSYINALADLRVSLVSLQRAAGLLPPQI